MKRRYKKMQAVCKIHGNELAPRLYGEMRFCDALFGVRVDVRITGLPPNATGFYGFHIHEGTSCSPSDFSGAGGHYDPCNARHPLHAGDMPMIMAAHCGTAFLSFVTPRFTVCEVLGRAVIIHQDRDDYTSQPSGSAGARIGCGIIQHV